MQWRDTYDVTHWQAKKRINKQALYGWTLLYHCIGMARPRFRHKNGTKEFKERSLHSGIVSMAPHNWQKIEGFSGKMGHLCVVLNVVMIAVKEWWWWWRGGTRVSIQLERAPIRWKLNRLLSLKSLDILLLHFHWTQIEIKKEHCYVLDYVISNHQYWSQKSKCNAYF